MGGARMRTASLRLAVALATAAAAVTLTLLMNGSPALAKGGNKGGHHAKGPKIPPNKHKHSHGINYASGRIGPIEIGMYRGTVSKALGAPESIHKIANDTGYTTHGKPARLYLATYEDGLLEALYSAESKLKRFWVVRSVATTSPVYTGALAVGKTFFPAPDCLTPDGQAGEGPGGTGTPETADFCRLDYENPFTYFAMSNLGVRASETIFKIIISTRQLGEGFWRSLFEEEMENSQCFEPECSVHTN
jgi:hypothetical protein